MADDQLVLPSDMPQSSDAPDPSEGLTLPSDLAEQQQAAAQPGMASDIAKGAATGLAKGAAAIPGAPGDISRFVDWGPSWLIAKGAEKLGFLPKGKTAEDLISDANNLDLPRDPTQLPTSADTIGAMEKVTGKLPDAKTAPGRFAQTIGEFAPAALGGEGSVASRVLHNAVIPAAASEGAGKLTEGTALEPAARIIGGIGGGMAASAALKAGTGAVQNAIKPLTASGQAQLAGERLAGNASDLDSVKQALADAPSTKMDDGSTATGQSVPGSQPTTFQLTGDMGLGSREKVLETSDPVPFNMRRSDQNAARLGVLPQSAGAPEDLASRLRSHLAHLDELEAGNVTSATHAAQDAVTGLGGQQSADFYGRQIAGAAQPQIDAATAARSQALDAMGGTGTPEEYGAQMRGVAQDAADVARAHKNGIYDAIDPHGDLNTVATGPRQRANEMAEGLSKYAAPPTGEEAAIMAQMRSMPDVVPFRDLYAMEQRITAARTAEQGRTPAWGRLTQLKSAVSDAIANGAGNQLAYERHGIATGQIPATEADLEARLRTHWGINVDGRAIDASSGLARTGTGPVGFSGVGPASGAGGNRAGRSTTWGAGQASGDQGVSQPPLVPNHDEAAADRLTIAKRTNAAFMRHFENGPVGQMLDDNGIRGQYKLIDAGVPNTVFQPGPKGAQVVRSYLATPGIADNPKAQAAVRNYAAMSLRRAAVGPDGAIDRPAYARWLNQHQDALRAMPAGTAESYANVHAAQQSLDRFSPFTSGMAPSAVPEAFFHAGPSGGDAVNNLRGLIGDRAASTSLTDYAASRLRSAAMNQDGTLDPRKVATFVKAHGPALDALPGLKDRFSDAAAATDTISRAAAARKAATDAYQRDAAGKVIGSTEPSDITRMVGDIFGKQNATAQMKDLATKAQAAGPDAMEGLRKAVVDHIHDRFISNRESGTTGANKIAGDAFQKFARAKSPALSQVLNPAEVRSMQAVADDIARSNRSVDAMRIPAQSGTAHLQSHVAPAEHGHGSSWLQNLFFISHGARELAHMAGHIPFVGEAAEHLIGHLGLPVVAGKKLLNAMQARGYKKVDDLERDAMLHPHLARDLLANVHPHGPGRASQADRITRLLVGMMPFYGAQATDGQQQPAYASGGSVDFSERALDFSASDAFPWSVAHERKPTFASGGRVEPSEAQKVAGNYAKEHLRYLGLDISIENPKGSTRSGIGLDGKPWSVKMPCAYGYVRGTTGADGDHLDCFVGPDLDAPNVFIIKQMHLRPRRFDEHKVMLGFKDHAAAMAAYTGSFSDGKGKGRIGQVLCKPKAIFPTWARSAAAASADLKCA